MPETSTNFRDFSVSETDLPVIPVPRAAHCPLRPPPEFANWREEPGLRRAMWNGQPIWSVSRYQDIRAALVDPRLSADTIPDRSSRRALTTPRR